MVNARLVAGSGPTKAKQTIFDLGGGIWYYGAISTEVQG
jgi:hypothetical protein